MTVALRPAGPDDQDFLYGLYSSTRAEEIAAWGWGAAEREMFLKMQFAAQQRHYDMQADNVDHRIILLEGRAVGRLLVIRTGREVRLGDISLLPECRGRGIGASLIRGLQAEAAREAKPLTLNVARDNPAVSLYRRLGFEVSGESGFTFQMQWQAPRSSAGGNNE